jgi:YVTN family beta-propeller protein
MLAERVLQHTAVLARPCIVQGAHNEGAVDVCIDHFALFPAFAHAQKLLQYVAMDSPIAVAVNPVTNMVYAANYTGNTVGVLDGNTNAVIATIPVGSGPFALAVNPVTNLVYVSNSGSPQGTGMSVRVIDGGSNTVTGTLPLSSYPGFIAVNPSTNLVYFTIEGGHR